MAAKESLELLTSLSLATDTLADKVLADGEVTLLDARYLPELISELRPGLEGLQKIKEEVSTYTPDELQAVITALVDLGLKIATKVTPKE